MGLHPYLKTFDPVFHVLPWLEVARMFYHGLERPFDRIAVYLENFQVLELRQVWWKPGYFISR